jgi:hypothetical protein
MSMLLLQTANHTYEYLIPSRSGPISHRNYVGIFFPLLVADWVLNHDVVFINLHPTTGRALTVCSSVSFFGLGACDCKVE